jgi:hypothetical protein
VAEGDDERSVPALSFREHLTHGPPLRLQDRVAPPARRNPPRKEADGDPRVEAIAEAARRLDELRRDWLSPEGAREAELEKRTLTNLYNEHPTWLQNVHIRFNAAVVFATYGWPSGIVDEKILKNLLYLALWLLRRR